LLQVQGKEAEDMTAYQAYRTMKWTKATDSCEEGCGATLAEGTYVEGRLGHYCSAACRAAAEAGGDTDERGAERRQMGVGG
jgi:hypothetical protein